MQKYKENHIEDYEILLSELRSYEEALGKFKSQTPYESYIVEGVEEARIYDLDDKKNLDRIESNLKRIREQIKYYETKEQEKFVKHHNEIKAPRHIKGSENKKAIEKLDKTLDSDSDYGLDIDELKDDPLHQLLMKNPFYKLFYSTYRLNFNGLYEDIPLHFVVLIQNIFRFQKKIGLPKKILKPLNCMIMSASGKAKTARMDFCIDIAKDLGVPMEPVSQETGASLRGTVTAPKNADKYEYDIVPGSIKSCLLFIDEFRNALLRTHQDTQFKSYLLELAEKNEMKADTVTAKQTLITYEKWKLAIETEEDEVEKKKLLQLDLKCETDGYRMDFPTGNLMFKSNSGLFIYSQPITNQAGKTERDLQRSFCLSQGYYNRFIFRYNPKPLTPVIKIKYKAERITYIKRMKAYHNVKSDTILTKKYTKEIVKLLKQFPVTKMKADTEFIADLQAQFDNSLPKNIRDLLSSEHQTLLRENMDSYTDRMAYNIFPNLVYLLAYINGKNVPEAEEIEATINFCNKSMEEYYLYLQEIMEEPIHGQFANIKVYTNLIMTDICSYFEEKTGDNITLDLYEKYPNSSGLLNNVKSKFKSLYSSNAWSNKKYQESISSLVSGNVIKVITEHPDTKNRFSKNAKKLIILKPYDNKRVLTSNDEIKKIKLEYR